MAADPDRVPWGNMYEFTLTGTFVVAALYVALYHKLRLAWMAPIVVAFVLSVPMVAVIRLYAPVEPLTEALASYEDRKSVVQGKGVTVRVESRVTSTFNKKHKKKHKKQHNH